ncbi:disulfide bond formation protein B [Candidatus Nomurabacteria bacterium]|nr:disulfide bond formation protein B [Candidatus Nomurabacteria bacterium]
MFSTLISLGIIVLQILTIVFVILWFKKHKFLNKIYSYSHLVLPIIFIGSALGSLIFEFVYGFEPCLLCWYQRISIFGIAILSLTGDIRKNSFLQNQVILFSIIGIAVALVHNYIDIFPSGLDICGAGPSCLKRYVYEFGYITIPMMSLTVLVSGLVISLFAKNQLKKSTF